jgi:hypothetical protein
MPMQDKEFVIPSRVIGECALTKWRGKDFSIIIMSNQIAFVPSKLDKCKSISCLQACLPCVLHQEVGRLADPVNVDTHCNLM